MKYVIILILGFAFPQNSFAYNEQGKNTQISFNYVDSKLSELERQEIEAVILVAERDVRSFFPQMVKNIVFSIQVVDLNLDIVGGVTGIALTNKPIGKVSISISKYNSEGYIGSIRKGLRGTILHELHHIAHGWVMEGNKFGPGIYIAVANEGLASVFSEILTGDSFLSHGNKEEVDQWVKEILKLPLDADYMHWVSGTHPDGRSFIGYKAGKHLVYKALSNSKKNILELSKLPVDLLYNAAGY